MEPPRVGRPVFRLEIQTDADGARKGAPEGWIYVAGAGPGLLRIGRARNAPRGAARDWKPHVWAYARVADRYAAEAALHAAMAANRVVGTRLYRLTAGAAIAMMRDRFGEVIIVPQAER